MKLLLKSLIVICLLICFALPAKAFAAVKKVPPTETYLSVTANGQIQPGIYKLVGTTLKPALKGTVYKLQSKKIGDFSFVNTLGMKTSYKNSKGFDPYSYMTKQYNYPVKIGNTVYFAKFKEKISYGSYQCGGGSENLFNLYKITNGKASKVNSDNISDGQGNPLYSYGGNIYYVEGKGLSSSYNVVKLTTKGKKSVILKSISDFWMSGTKSYYQKNGKIYNYNFNTKRSTAIKNNVKVDFYSASVCEGPNYQKVTNGLVYYGYDDDFNYIHYFYDYATGKSVKFVEDSDNVSTIDILPSKDLVLTCDYDTNKYFIYNLKGKKMKNLSIPAKSQLISVSLAKHTITYLSGTTVKKLSF